MNMRTFLLRLVFGSLAMTACWGAVAVVFAGHDTLWRVVWTCAATAGGALLLLGATSLYEQEAMRRSGILATALVLAEYLLVLGQIWAVFGRAEQQAGVTILFLALTGLPAIAFLAMLAQLGTVLAGRVGLAISGAGLVLLMVGTWGSGWGTPRFDDNRWFEVSASLAAFGFLAVLALAGAGRDRRHWRWLGVAAAGAAFLMSTYAIVAGIRSSSSVFVCLATVAVVVAHANVMLLLALWPAQEWLRRSTIGAAIVTGLLVDLGRVTRPWQEELLGRLAGAGAIIAGCGTLALLVLARVNRGAAPTGRPVSELCEIRVVCPVCGTRQTVPLGTGRCARCGLGITVRLEESTGT